LPPAVAAARWNAVMPLSLQVMAALGLLAGLLGLPLLVTPAFGRRLLRMEDTPQAAYVLRIAGAMLASLGLILIVFAFAYAAAA
jgi:uncharacterized protein YjeT (DUF2065 family)